MSITDFFKTGLVQAPLAGYSCAPFRQIAWQWGRPDFCCTEMLSARHLYTGAPQRMRYRYKSPEEGPLCVQLSGSGRDELLYATESVMSWGADLIDLNCGCPMPKIRKKQEGSQLLSDSKHLAGLVAAIKSATHLPVLIKIRVDGESGERYHLDVARAVEEAGVDAITVHGRHWTERYDSPARYDQIAQVKQAVSIPVIGNGDVHDTASAKRLFDETQCDAVMIARACVGQPWLFAEIAAGLKGESFKKPDLATIGEIFLEHVRGLMTIEPEKVAVLQSRKFAKYYIRGQLPDEVLRCFFHVETYQELERLVRLYFQSAL